MPQSQHWVVVADQRRAVLFAFKRVHGGGYHLEELSAIENGHEGEHEHHRPDLLGGAERSGSRGDTGASASPRSASFGHQDDEEHLRFAREVNEWLGHSHKELRPDRVCVFAAAHFLGLLRKQIGAHIPGVDYRVGELTRLSSKELAEHPAVKHALEFPLDTSSK